MFIISHVSGSARGSPHAVRIELDAPGGNYQIGDTITGRVVVVPGKSDQSPLSIELQRYTHGRVKSVAAAAEQFLFAGPWQAGVTMTFPFQLRASRRGGRYQGRLVNLEVRLAAVLPRSDLTAWRFPELVARAYPAAVQSVTVDDPRPLVVRVDGERARASANRGLMVFFASLALCTGVVAFLAGVAMLLDIIPIPNAFIALAPLGGGLVFTTAGAIGLDLQLKRWWIGRKIGNPAVAVQSVGEQVEVWVRLPGDLAVTSVRATFRAFEHVRISAGRSTYIEEHVIADHVVELARTAERGLYHARFPLSALAALPPAGGLHSACVAWRLLLQIELSSGARWEDAIPLSAFPGDQPPNILSRHLLLLTD